MTEGKSRAEKASETRDRVVDRALDLFLVQGYARTTTRDIAAAARVTERTLFNIVPTKSELLRQVMLRHVFAGQAAPVLERADFAPVVRTESGLDFLVAFADWVAALHRRSAPLAEVVRTAASVDAGAAELWQWGVGQQVADCRSIVGLMHRRGWLPPGLRRAESADSLAVLSGHETYHQLVDNQHWPLARYRRWLVRHCAADLLGAPLER